MNFLDSFLASLRALRANVLRSVLTTLGIIIGVAAVITMVSVGAGAEAQVQELISSLGSNLIIVLPGAVTSGGVRMGHGTRQSLTEDDAWAIARDVPEVQVAAPTVRGTAQLIAGNLNWSTAVYGVTPEYLEAREWDLSSGRAFSAEDEKAAAKVVLLGETVIRNLFGNEDPLGQMIRIRRVPFTVIGVLEKKGQTPVGQDQDDAVMIPLKTARKRVLGGSRVQGKTVGAISVKIREAELVSQAEEKIKALLRERHRLRAGQEEDFSLRNLSQLLETRAESSRTLSILLAAVASVSLIVGGIGIMNIMLVSVTERTREIGLRMAVGARRRDILSQFLIEAVSLSLVGGLIGVAVGVGGSILATVFGNWPMIVEMHAVGMAFGFSAAVGVFFGFYPARKAAGLDPIEALRYE